MLLEKGKGGGQNGQTRLNVPPPIDPLAEFFGSGLDEGLLESLSKDDASDLLGEVLNKYLFCVLHYCTYSCYARVPSFVIFKYFI